MCRIWVFDHKLVVRTGTRSIGNTGDEKIIQGTYWATKEIEHIGKDKVAGL